MATLLSCEICGQQDDMYTEADVRTHMLLVHEEQGPTCPLCDLSELTLEELQIHINTAHVELLSPAAKKMTSHTDHHGNTLEMKHSIGATAQSNTSTHNRTQTKPHTTAASAWGQHVFPTANGISPYNNNKTKLKMAAVFPNSPPEQNGIASSIPALSNDISHNQHVESADRQSLPIQGDYPEADTAYPLQLRGPDDCISTNQKMVNGQSNNNSDTIPHDMAFADDSMETDMLLDGSMLLVSDSDDDCTPEPSNSLDSPTRKRPRNTTSSSRSLNCSSLNADDRVTRSSQVQPKSPLKRFIESITPKKMSGEESALNVDSPSGIWFDSDDSIHDALPGQSSTENECNIKEDTPECPFCNVQGLNADSMTQHIEEEHGDLLSPTAASSHGAHTNQKNTSIKQPKTTLLSLSQKANKLESAILCPICGLGSYDPDFLTVHIDTEHPDLVEGGKQTENNSWNNPSTSSHRAEAAGSSAGDSSGCPVCGAKGFNQADLARHVEEHFEDTSQKRGGVCSEDDKLARQLADQEKQLRERKEKEEFKRLQAQYGMDGAAGYQAQSETALEKAVARGQMSVSDYYQQKGRIKQIVATGIDGGLSCTQGLTDNIEAFYGKENNRNVSFGRVCGPMDHYGATAGDRGWGCGYRNLQMLLSGMMRQQTYKDVVFNGRNSMPSIGKLQQLIETAWEQGWDPQGREQLGGTVKNTKKWIGATEVVALLSSLKSKCLLIDFHKPTGPNGTHPKMFDWVRDYFGQPGGRLFNRGNQVRTKKMSLYLQHQGHSRTIIGYEVLKDNSIRLLIFDPSMSQRHLQSLQAKDLTATAMQPIRKSLAQMKAKQYQIVGVEGVYTNDREHQQSKLIRSQRIP